MFWFASTSSKFNLPGGRYCSLPPSTKVLHDPSLQKKTPSKVCIFEAFAKNNWPIFCSICISQFICHYFCSSKFFIKCHLSKKWDFSFCLFFYNLHFLSLFHYFSFLKSVSFALFFISCVNQNTNCWKSNSDWVGSMVSWSLNETQDWEVVRSNPSTGQNFCLINCIVYKENKNRFKRSRYDAFWQILLWIDYDWIRTLGLCKSTDS